MYRHRIFAALLAGALCGCQSAAAQATDPPSQVGRVSDVIGAVSLLPVDDTVWSDASLNYPLTSGDQLWADADARAEIDFGASSVHLAPSTALALDAIEEQVIQLRIGQGAVQVRVRELLADDSYEIDTPAGPVLLRSAGDYRIDVTPDGQRTTVTVREGNADIMIGDQAYPVRPATSATILAAGSRPIMSDAPIARDDWENWADARDQQADAAVATRYVSPDMVGYEDLDTYGDWQVDATYGPIWYPRSVAADWAPYRDGHWESVQPWGWTWIDDAPWGFAPFHYGRWSHNSGRWGWIPGTRLARPVYAPALVAYVSGDGWGASLSFGSSGGVGWVPLGPNEVFVPAYHTTATYRRNVNSGSVNVTRVDVNRFDPATAHFVNRNVPGAVTAVPRDAFVGSRPVSRAAVRVPRNDLTAARTTAAPVAAGRPIAAPRGGSPARARPANAGTVRRPPVALPRASRPAMRPSSPAGTPTPRPATPNAAPARGRANVTPPRPSTPSPRAGAPARPATAPARGRATPTRPTPAAPPTAPTRGRATPTRPTPAAPRAAPTRGRATPTRPTPATPTHPTTPAPARKPVLPANPGRGTPPRSPTIPARGHGKPADTVHAAPARSTPATPAHPTTSPARKPAPPANPARGHGKPADTSHARKPTAPDTGRGGGTAAGING